MRRKFLLPLSIYHDVRGRLGQAGPENANSTRVDSLVTGSEPTGTVTSNSAMVGDATRGDVPQEGGTGDGVPERMPAKASAASVRRGEAAKNV